MADQDLPEDRGERDSRETYGRLVLPLLIPATAFLFAVLVIYGLSRIYLELNTYHVGDVSMATPLAIGVSLIILLAAFYLSSQQRISVFQIGGIFMAAALLLTAGGVWAAVHDESTGEASVVEPTPDGATPPAGGVNVSLIDPSWGVTVDPASTGAGEVTFAVTNDGTLVHNFNAVKSDLDPASLPYDEDNFQVDETQVDIIAKSANLPAGQSEDVTAQLEPGAYVLFCNVPAHYEAGMHTAFTVQ